MKKCCALLLVLLLLAGCRSIDAPISEDTDTDTALPAQATEHLPEETEAPEPEPAQVIISMVGDILLHEAVSESGLMADGTYQYDHLFAHVRNEIEASDVAIVNQEVILGGRELGLSGYPCFNGAFEVGDALVNAGFNVVLHATNHALDKGKTGILNCLGFWNSKYPSIAVLGIYDSAAAQDTIYIREENGIRIAILNYTYGTNGISLPADMPYAVGLLEESRVRADVAKAKEAADFVVVCPHWGTEYTHEPDAYQLAWTDIFYDCGVDLVIGTHPHVIQPVEVITGENGSMPVFYSLGNFINATAGTGSGVADRMVGAMAQITVQLDDAGNAVVTDYGVLPLVTHVRTGPGLITTYPLAEYTEALASENEIVASDPAFSLTYCENLCREVFGDLYS